MPFEVKVLFLVGIAVGGCLGQVTSPPAGETLAIVRDGGPPLILTAKDLSGMPREAVAVTEHSGEKASYDGVPLREILKRAGAPSGKELRGKVLTTYVLATAHDGYQVVFSLGEVDAALGNESILVADKRDGKPLPESLGPLRLVCRDDKAGARSVRMLEKLEIVRLSK